jgi:hypothetical protein
MPFDNPAPRPSRSRVKREEQEAAAFELTEAQAARRQGEVRWEAAMKRAVKAAVVPDFVLNPEPVGTTRQTYVDNAVSVTLFVAQPIEGMDSTGLLADLQKAGVDQKLLNRLTRKHHTETRAAHRITTTFVSPRAPFRRGRAR